MRFSTLLVCVLLIAGCSLAGDITPPPALATSQAAQQVNPPTRPPSISTPVSGVLSEVVPAVLPDLDRGAAIYAENCEPCHGALGLGEGEVAADLSVEPSSLGERDFAREAIPSDWYEVVTTGRMDRFMPPFISLTDTQRWEAVVYALSLSGSIEQFSLGAEIYEAECASCHGADGDGGTDGPSLTDPVIMAERSLADLFSVISEGSGLMPGFGDEMTEPGRWAVARYTRGLAWGIESNRVSTEPVAAHPQELGTIQGSLSNATTGGPIPAGLEILLIGTDDASLETISQTSEVGEDGEFIFEGLEIVPGRMFMVFAEYQGVLYNSERAHLIDPETPLTLPVVVFESSEDISSITVALLHLIITHPVEGIMRVEEVWVFSNLGDRTVVAPDDQELIRFELPDQAELLDVTQTTPFDRLVPTDKGFMFSTAVYPGARSTQFSFLLEIPYDRMLQISQPVGIPVESVVVLSEESDLALSTRFFKDEGLIDMGGGFEMRQYSSGPYKPGEMIQWSFSRPLISGGQLTALAMLIGAILSVGAWFFRRQAKFSTVTDSEQAPSRVAKSDRGSLLHSIAGLDNEFEAGTIPEDEYRRKRDVLKRELISLMKAEDDRG